MKNTIRILIVLFGILVVSMVMLALGQDEVRANPISTHYGPSGTRALTELLQRRGYRVRVESRARPVIDPQEVIISFKASDHEPSAELQVLVTDHVQGGGRALIGNVDGDFRAATDRARTETEALRSQFLDSIVVSEVDPSFYSSSRGFFQGDDLAPSWASFPDVPGTPLYQNDAFAAASLFRVGAGFAVFVPDALPATNRFLDQHQNAQFVLTLVQGLAEPGATLVMLDAYAGRIDQKGLLATIGDWMLFTWWQLLFLFLVAIYTFGRRLGLPEFDRPKQSGQRDLVDAVGYTFRHARAVRMGLRAVGETCDRRARELVKLNRDAPTAEREARLPDALRQLFATVEMEADDPALAPQRATALAAQLEREVDNLAGGPRTPRKRRKR